MAHDVMGLRSSVCSQVIWAGEQAYMLAVSLQKEKVSNLMQHRSHTQVQREEITAVTSQKSIQTFLPVLRSVSSSRQPLLPQIFPIQLEPQSGLHQQGAAITVCRVPCPSMPEESLLWPLATSLRHVRVFGSGAFRRL